MLRQAFFSYGIVAAAWFVVFVLLGVVLRKDVLRNGVKLGILNSALLSAFWPITVACLAFGICYDLWQGWKRL